MKNADKPINPVLTQSPSLQNDTSLGLTKREYFAGLAMQAMISNMKPSSMNGIEKIPSNIAKWSLLFADELLKQLENENI